MKTHILLAVSTVLALTALPAVAANGLYDFEDPNPYDNKAADLPLDGDLTVQGNMSLVGYEGSGDGPVQASHNPGTDPNNITDWLNTQCNTASSKDVLIHAWIRPASDGVIRKAAGTTSHPINDDQAGYNFYIEQGKLAWFADGCNWRNHSLAGNAIVTDGRWPPSFVARTSATAASSTPRCT